MKLCKLKLLRVALWPCSATVIDLVRPPFRIGPLLRIDVLVDDLLPYLPSLPCNSHYWEFIEAVIKASRNKIKLQLGKVAQSVDQLSGGLKDPANQECRLFSMVLSGS